MERLDPQENFSSHPFLALTALEEFWDKTAPVYFLGEWCLRPSRRSIWEPLIRGVIPTPWVDQEQVHQACQQVDSFYERVLPRLGDALNELHSANFSPRSWRIMLGPWLFWYLTAIYDRYFVVRNALHQCPDLVTWGMAEESFRVPRDTLEFVSLVYEDAYNLQVLTRVLRFIGVPMRHGAWTYAPVQSLVSRDQVGISRRAKSALKRTVAWLEASAGSQFDVVLRDSYFPRNAEIAMLLRSRGRIRRNFSEPIRSTSFPVDNVRRQRLNEAVAPASDFERCVKELMPDDVPQCFVEGFEHLGQASTNEFPNGAKVILSANSWYFDESFKRWSAAAAEGGAVLLGVQHGGNYGSIEPMPSEAHEIRIVDHYYSWGWTQPGSEKVSPMPATKLMGKEITVASRRGKDILCGATSMPRYLFQFPFPPHQFSAYLDWQRRFVEQLSPSLRRRLRFRFHYADFGWEIAPRLAAVFPDLAQEKWETPFCRSLQDCGLYVCDHLSTTFIESLAADVPTLLYWDPLANPLRQEAEQYYQVLRESLILHDSPESAARLLEEIQVDIPAFWSDPKRQEARRCFCHRFARTSDHATSEWIAELRRVVAVAENGTTVAPQTVL